jgi:tripartite ATP-independent transporter DctM subunit
MLTALIGFAVLFVLLLLRVPIAFAMAAVGFVGFASIVGWQPALASVGQTGIDTVFTYMLSVLPLFIMMGTFVAKSGLAEELYHASNVFIGHRRGGLALATILACGGFSAVCGSSLATAATISRIAMPSMRRYGYSDGLAAGSIAAGGTLGILIPPSVILVIYGIMTNTDIGKLFIAGLLPGALGIVLYMTAISVVTRLRPELSNPAERASWAERGRALWRTWGVFLLFGVVMGGIYFGVFTPTESAGIGAMGALVFAISRRGLDFAMLREVLAETAITTSMMFVLLIGAILFANFLNVSGMPAGLARWIGGLDVHPLIVIGAIVATYVVLGCMLESLSMMLLTVPVFYPIVQTLGMDLIWFGIIVVVVIEIGLITPPIGLNVFMLKTLMPEIPTSTIFAGVLPFIVVDIIRVALLILIPGIVLFLPGRMT